MRDLLHECNQLRATLPELAGVKQLEADLRHLLELLYRDEQSPRVVAAAAVASGIGASSFEVTWGRGDIRLAIADQGVEVGARLKRLGWVENRDGAYAPRKKSAREVLHRKSPEELLRDSTR